MEEISFIVKENDKKPYSTPILKIFGKVSELTTMIGSCGSKTCGCPPGPCEHQPAWTCS